MKSLLFIYSALLVLVLVVIAVNSFVVSAQNTSSGILWNVSVSNKGYETAVFPPAVDSTTVYACDSLTLKAFNKFDGSMRWQFNVNTLSNLAGFGGGVAVDTKRSLVYAFEQHGLLLALNSQNGKLVWKSKVANTSTYLVMSCFTPQIFFQDKVLILTLKNLHSGVVAIDLSHAGKPLWWWSSGGAASQIVSPPALSYANGGIVVVTRTGLNKGPIALSVGTGRVSFRFAPAAHGYFAPTCSSGCAASLKYPFVYCNCNSVIAAYDAFTGVLKYSTKDTQEQYLTGFGPRAPIINDKDGLLYISHFESPASNQTTVILAFDITTGKIVFRTERMLPIQETSIFWMTYVPASSKLAVGFRNWDTAPNSTHHEDPIYLFDAKTGNLTNTIIVDDVIWGEVVVSSDAATGKRGYLGEHDGELLCVDLS